MRTLILDIETTGLPKKGDTYDVNFMDFPYIVSMAWKVNDSPVEEFVINQEGREIPKEASDINGITTKETNESKFFLPEILSKLLLMPKPDYVIGHNIYFDTSIVKANVLRLIKEGRMPQELFAEIEDFLHKDKRIDTMRKSIKFCGIGAFPKLSVLYQKLFNEEYFAHNNLNDVEATYRCYMKLKELGIITHELPIVQ